MANDPNRPNIANSGPEENATENAHGTSDHAGQTLEHKLDDTAQPRMSPQEPESFSPAAPKGNSPEIVSSIGGLPPLENYIARFEWRYKSELSFRNMVNKYMGLSRGQKFRLGLSKVFAQGAYERKTKQIITEYATRIRRETEKAMALKQQLTQLESVSRQYESASGQFTEKTKQEESIKAEAARLTAEYQALVSSTRNEAEVAKQVAAQRANQEKLRIEAEKNAEKIIAAKAKEFLVRTGLVNVSAGGQLNFDEAKVMNKLEDLFLEEIIEGIEKEDGPGFFSKTKIAYEGIISYWSEMEDLGELDKIDWIQSIILSRTKGYRRPQYPFLVTGKPDQEMYKRKKASVNSATSVDVSGSMEGTKLELAKKCVLAQHALMRKLNPQNASYLSAYSNTLVPVDSISFFRNAVANGGTNTDLAVKWLYESLADNGPGMAYLITDGAPTCGWDSLVNQLSRFKDQPHLRLRIFLIDGDTTTIKTVREMGQAAGQYTKVIPVKEGGLGKGVIREMGLTIEGMYDIDKF